ncbi:Glycosyl transferase, family 48 [Corchorus olitorius]|uniref:1,3-beta-glucan synthase n=1 Tax=Corchorus olitorius TaxID=93759 RepID=A0A1R3IT10_9ROSI|nr:Glycosyl transferase, family 48 [Corchorus olitorius]
MAMSPSNGTETGSQSSPPLDYEPYNIIPTNNLHLDHPSHRYPQVGAAISTLRFTVCNLRKPPCSQWLPSMDLLDWLGLFFGFQRDNVKNQREHLVLHLANAQMRLSPPPDNTDTIEITVLQNFRKKLLNNYSKWCSHLGINSNVWIPEGSSFCHGRELLYIGLYLLIWGESANLRFMPECICYIFHHMAMDLNKILEDYIDENTGMPAKPSTYGENEFLNSVVKPIYEVIKVEVESSKDSTVLPKVEMESGKEGSPPHSTWRNYDDFNEYFWSKRCFQDLKWPIVLESDFFLMAYSTRKSKRKTGFVEHRTFWNVYRSFDRLWVMLALFFQVAVILAWQEMKYPWQALNNKVVKVRLLTLFITWSGMRFLHAFLEAAMECSRVSREAFGFLIRMVLKILVAVAWTYAFVVCYRRIWMQRNYDQQWSDEANKRVIFFLQLAFLYVLPEFLELALFFLPRIRSFIEHRNWKICYLMSWWFHGNQFVGQGLREGLVDSVKYILFWAVVLSTKFAFSYFLQIKPMISSTKQLLDLNNSEYEWEWHEPFSVSIGKKIAIGLLWLPVVLIYLADTQIWFSIFSTCVGAGVGLFQRLGEIRNTQQLRLRFQFFVSAIQFNLLPQEQSEISSRSLRGILTDAIHHLKLRYGFEQPFKKIESNQVDARKFALIWNEIITTFREEDILSDREVELLELPCNSWNIRVIRWPCFLIGNELLYARVLARELRDAPDNWLWHKICKNEYRRCAVIETYDSVKHLMLEIVNNSTEEHSIVKNLFAEIDHFVEIEKFTKTFEMNALGQIHPKLIRLVELLLEPEKEASQVVYTLQALYGMIVHDFFKEKRTINQLREDGLAPPYRTGMEKSLFENAVELPEPSHKNFYRQVKRLQTILTTRDSMQNIPANIEARRRLAFFSNSLFMEMPPAPQVKRMMAFSVLTPFYDEDVLYSKEKLKTKNEDGVSILYYLQTIYDDEWENFMERMHREGMVRGDAIWTTKLRDLRLWASYRGQTLARTIRGMMYYSRALRMLAFLDSASEMDIREEEQKLGFMGRDGAFDGFKSQGPPPRSLSRTNTSVSSLSDGHEYGIALMKFTFIVSCQKYREQKAKRDPCAEEIADLLKHNEALRIAYVDQVSIGRVKEYYSVLVKYDQKLQREVEIYRVKLPGPLKLGEGKPENQNHAFIFTRGDAVQTIDMNQDNYFEEALKIRNLLEEFSHYNGIRKPTILGVREHIFTGSISSLAWFMFWFMTRGGLSKASKTININEDIFAGYNCTLRGGSVTHHEYIQVGKGRDLGLNQISMFEAKIACGSGEQVVSRDIYRLGQRLDFFRMLSFFHTTVGYYFNTTVVILTVYAFLWGQLYLALSGLENYVLGGGNNDKKALTAVIHQEIVIQFGLFTTLPAVVESSVENGYLQAIWEFFLMQLQLSVVFYTFSMGTRAHYFGRTILHGGAKYRATGRDFVVKHTSFAENYRLYARSHFTKGIELGLILTVYAKYTQGAKDTFFYIDMAVTCWLLVLSWIFAPFLFNPVGFDWLKTVNDFDDFIFWIWNRAGGFAKAEQSWERWWYEEQDHLRTTSLWGKLLEIMLDLRFFYFQYGIVYHSGHSKSFAVYLLSWIYFFIAFGIYLTMSYLREKYEAKEHIYFRLAQSLLFAVGILVITALLMFTNFELVDIFNSLLAFIPTGWGLVSIAQVFRPFLQHTRLWDCVVSVARLYDLLFGLFVMAPVAVLSWMPWFQSMQTRILFNDSFSKGLQMLKIITEKKHVRPALRIGD